jgi:hypothetical protein
MLAQSWNLLNAHGVGSEGDVKNDNKTIMNVMHNNITMCHLVFPMPYIVLLYCKSFNLG